MDARAVFEAARVVDTRTPAESSLLVVVQSLRELLDLRRLRKLWWIDTRDMLTDGMTKGAIARGLIQKVCSSSIWAGIGDRPLGYGL